MKSTLAATRAQRFCRALEQRIRGRRQHPAWVAIADVAREMKLPADDAILLAHECELAGLVHHDLSSKATAYRHGEAVPHSVSLTASGWAFLEGDRPVVPRRRGLSRK